MRLFWAKNKSKLLFLIGCGVVLLIVKFVIDTYTLRRIQDIGQPTSEYRLPDDLINFIPQYSSVAQQTQQPPSTDDILSYQDFLDLYGDRRIQIDGSCRATPSSLSLSVGDSIIFDNRSEKIQALKFMGDLYALPPFHVRLFKLSRQGIFNVDCGSSRNILEILVH